MSTSVIRAKRIERLPYPVDESNPSYPDGPLPRDTCYRCGLRALDHAHLTPGDCISALRDRLARFE